MTESNDFNSPAPWAWPNKGSWQEKQAVVQQLRAREPDPVLAEAARIALTVEEDSQWVSSLMCAVARHIGKEGTGSDGVHWYGSADLISIYRDALSKTPNPRVRIALHNGFSSFTPLGSTDNKIRREHADLLNSLLSACVSASETNEIVQILRNRSHYSPSELFRAIDGLLAEDRVTFWRDNDVWLWGTLALESAADGYFSKQVIENATRRLYAALPQIKDPSVLTAVVKQLSERFLDPTRLADLRPYLNHEAYDIYSSVGKAMVRWGEQGLEALRATLQKAEHVGSLYNAWDRLKEAETPDDQLVHLLMTNPATEAAADCLVSRCFRAGSGDGHGTLRRMWPFLPYRLRQALEEHSQREESKYMLPHDELSWEFHRAFRDNAEQGLTAAHLHMVASALNRPIHEKLGCYDFEAIIGLKRWASVTFHHDERLRFRFLAGARTPAGLPLRELAHETQEDLDDLAELEAALDLERDRLATLRGEIATLSHNLGSEVVAAAQEARGHRRELGESAWDDVLADLIEKMGTVERLASGQAERYWRLDQATRRLLPRLREAGCDFQGLAAPDGVLGEYQPRDRSVTLFGPMIELAALEVARILREPTVVVEPLVRTIVELHELAHAHLHLGVDADGKEWERLEEASRGFHEAWAQLLTRRLVEQRDEPQLLMVLSTIEEWLPPEYRFGNWLTDQPAETLRSRFVERRRGIRPQYDLISLTEIVVAALPGYASLLRPTLTHLAYTDLLRQLHQGVTEAARMMKPREAVAGALYHLLRGISALPRARMVLGPFLPGGWPSDESLLWLAFDLLVAGEPIGDETLRIIRPQALGIAVAASKSSLGLQLRPALRECEHLLAELRKQAASRGTDTRGRGRKDRHARPA